MSLYGYAGKILRVDLTEGKISEEEASKDLTERFVGGSGFGAKYLYDEVKPGTEWNDQENRLIIAVGPTAGTKIAGSGGCSIISKGPMTNLAGTSQANGYFGAFLKLSGYDAIVIHGRSPEWVYLSIRNGRAELRDARFLRGKDTFETEDAIKEALGEPRKHSVLSIGPAGENLVRFAMISGDRGHIASKNGLGAVMGWKNLKAVAAYRGENRIQVKDPENLLVWRKKLFEHAKKARVSTTQWGTQQGFDSFRLAGQLPVLNYTTNVFPEDDQMNTRYIRTHYEMKPTPCWACGMHHCHWVKVTEGPYKGIEGAEPEYECVAAWGPLIGNRDMGAVVMLSDLTDRLGLDVNESGWVISWVMECYEKGVLTREQLDGLDMKWGNVEAVKGMLIKMSHREGFGGLLAEGVKRASEKIGGDAPNMGVYTMKGATPRGHDHRGRWYELFETCVSSTSTLEFSVGSIPTQLFGWPPVGVSFSPWEISTSNARINGWLLFLDSSVLCRFCAIDPDLTAKTVNAITGWDLDREKILIIGKRIANQLRMFNLLHGLDIATETPSPRYGSTPTDGPNKGKSIMAHWEFMKQNYFETMGWNKETGVPHAHTLQALGLGDLIEDLDRI